MYPVISDVNNSAFISFERISVAPILGSTTVFAHVKDDYQCKYGSGFKGQLLAVIDKGNPFSSNMNESGLRIESKNNFKILIRNMAGFKQCDTVLSFDSKPGKEYKMISYSMLSTSHIGCDVELLEKISDENEYKKVTFNDYKSC